MAERKRIDNAQKSTYPLAEKGRPWLKYNKNIWTQPRCYDRFPYDCPWCDIKFENQKRIEVHVVNSHKFNCNNCMKEMKTWKDFLKHAETCEMSKKNIPFYDEFHVLMK
jgi:uncharacterized C2H2 Zn-finger protein